jgi:hypothetical protein
MSSCRVLQPGAREHQGGVVLKRLIFGSSCKNGMPLLAVEKQNYCSARRWEKVDNACSLYYISVFLFDRLRNHETLRQGHRFPAGF